MGETGDATERVNAIEQAVERVIVRAHPHELTRSQRNRVPDFRRPRLLLARRQNAAVPLIAALVAKGVLTEDRAPEIAHLQKVAHVNVFGCDPGHDGVVVTW